MTSPPVGLVRRALERAFTIAIEGERAQPAVAAPTSLRPLLRFQKLPTSALATVAHALDTDDEFRRRVAEQVERDDIGLAAWLWITRPDGWKDELAALLDEIALDDQPAEGGRRSDKRATDRTLRRQLEGAERSRDRAVDSARRAEAEVERLRHDLADVTAERDAFAAQLDEMHARIEQLSDERSAAVADLKRVKSVLARRTDEKRQLVARVEELEELAKSGTERQGGEQSGEHADPASEPSPAVAAMQNALDDLQRRAESFADEIDSLRRKLDNHAAVDAGGTVDTNGHREGAPASRGGSAAPPRRRRRPVPVPGGLTDDSEQTAAHLLARPGAVLLVDGYNLSMSAWPDLDIADQRARLERVLTDLAARYSGLVIELVFDGAEVLPLSRPGQRRAPGVSVRFTPPDVEADDELLELCENYPHDRPVIVASNDRRVRDGARRRGANVLSADQLLAVARRGPS